jgi:hypothetical protein
LQQVIFVETAQESFLSEANRFGPVLSQQVEGETP